MNEFCAFEHISEMIRETPNVKTNNVGKDILEYVDITEEAIVGGGKAVLIVIRD